MRYGRPKKLSAAQQFIRLRWNPNCPGQGTIRQRQLTWRFQVRPTPLSRIYDVRIEYKEGSSPKIFVDNPILEELAGDRVLPHVYSEKPARLCLYRQVRGDWDESKTLDGYIVPWVSLWLYYFEDWLATDDWKGGGEHPEPTATEDSPSLKTMIQRKRSVLGRTRRGDRS